MAKVGVITFLHNDNYGSALQAYALQKTIGSLGHECEHIDYMPENTAKLSNLLRSRNSFKLLKDSLKKRIIKAGQKGAQVKSAGFSEFYGKYMRLSPVCRNDDDLKQIAGRYDILVCGSDQVWNPVWFNPAYYLNFAHEGQERVAYACSLGVQTMPDGQKSGEIAKLVKPFRHISVREDEGAELLKAMTGKVAAVMPDPVCLLTPDEWRGLPCLDRVGGRYMLCYFIGENPEYWVRISEIRIKSGLRVLVLPVTRESYISGYELLDGAPPESIPGLIAGAALVCTDSFHCAVFAHLFDRETVEFMRYRRDDPDSKNSRMDHLHRLTKDGNGIFAALREEGISWLADALGGR